MVKKGVKNSAVDCHGNNLDRSGIWRRSDGAIIRLRRVASCQLPSTLTKNNNTNLYKCPSNSRWCRHETMKRNKIINNNSNASTGANANVSVDDTIATFANRLPANNIRRKQSLRPNQSHFPYFLLVRFFILFTFAFITIALVKLHFHLADIENRHAAGIYDGRSAKHSSQITNGQQPLKNQPLDIKISKSNIYESNERIPGRGAGSKRGKVHCDSDVSSLVSYWNNPLSDADREFQSPFLNNPSSNDVINSETRYLSFEPDKGGWNNIRMEFEIMVVLAAATGRTLILPVS